MVHPDDPYSRLNYRKLIAWPERIEREAPFLKSVFGSSGEERRLLDLGCGTGEHSRFFHSLGFDVTGVDRSEENLESARHGTEGPLFLAGDLRALDELPLGHFQGALCLGNTLPHLQDDGELRLFFGGLSRHLVEGARFLLQILNYERIHTKKIRSLPLNVRTGEGESIVFLRLMDPRPDGSVLFNPCTLRYRPGEEPPLEIVAAKNVLLRGWRPSELTLLLSQAGFEVEAFHGGMMREVFDPLESPDFVLVARRLSNGGEKSGTTLGDGGVGRK